MNFSLSFGNFNLNYFLIYSHCTRVYLFEVTRFAIPDKSASPVSDADRSKLNLFLCEINGEIN